jgi:hypothetical protein
VISLTQTFSPEGRGEWAKVAKQSFASYFRFPSGAWEPVFKII